MFESLANLTGKSSENSRLDVLHPLMIITTIFVKREFEVTTRATFLLVGLFCRKVLLSEVILVETKKLKGFSQILIM